MTDVIASPQQQNERSEQNGQPVLSHDQSPGAAEVAIIVPSYNCEHYVEQTLKSLLDQGEALRRVRCVILTDDCSKDDTIKVAREVWNGAAPLVVFDSARNRGEYRNMNECIARLPSSVKWYLVMHADNMAKPGWLEMLLNRIDNADERVGTICTSWDNLNEDGSIVTGDNSEPPTPQRIAGNAASVLGTIKKGCWWHISSCATRVDVYRQIGGLPAGFRLKGDWDFLLRLLGAGWDIEYVPQALMLYRNNPNGSSSISFRRHHDIYETLQILQRHHGVMSAADLMTFHGQQIGTLSRRFVGGVVRGHWERAIVTVPTSGFVIRSLAKCLLEKSLGRRRFQWCSSVDSRMEPMLAILSKKMADFYSLPKTRDAYQRMIDSEASAQPQTEDGLRAAVLSDDPKNILEVGCGSGRIYERLRKQGYRGNYTGVEMSTNVIADNKKRFPEADWHVGSGYQLPVADEVQDAVFSYYVLEHCAFPERFLSELLRVVRPGGKMVLTFPDMRRCRMFPSQACGPDARTAKEHLRSLRPISAGIRLLDSRVRLPQAVLKWTSAERRGAFPVNLNPVCLEETVEITPDFDAIYLSSREEVGDWALKKGCRVEFPSGEEGVLSANALIQITKPN
ncbi:MAG: methyltransferase domain-containing protein [Pseudomonadota bacterium]